MPSIAWAQDITPLQKVAETWQFGSHQQSAGPNTLNRLNGAEKCLPLASPGDFLLVYEQGVFNRTLKTLVAIKEILSFHDTEMKFGHAEFITDLVYPGNIITHSFYPDSAKVVGDGEAGFAIHDENDLAYRDHFAVFRVRSTNSQRTRERALYWQENHLDYWQKGVCSDYIAWLYDTPLTSSWNFIPLLQRLIEFVYPPEAIQTPDDLDDSPQSELICEVVDGELIFPHFTEEKPLRQRLEADRLSRSWKIRKHALLTLELLKNSEIRKGLIYLNDQGPIEDEAQRRKIHSWMIDEPWTLPPGELKEHFTSFKGKKSKQSKNEKSKISLLSPVESRQLYSHALLSACQTRRFALMNHFNHILKDEPAAADSSGRDCFAWAVYQRDTVLLSHLIDKEVKVHTQRPHSLTEIAASRIRWEDPALRNEDLNFYYQIKTLEQGLVQEAEDLEPTGPAGDGVDAAIELESSIQGSGL